MGAFMTRLKPKYVQNFNIENRVSRKMDAIATAEKPANGMSPRHPSTAKLFKEREESAPRVNDELLNRRVVEHTNRVTIDKKQEASENLKLAQFRAQLDAADKRPKKENERHSGEPHKFDIDLDRYGYVKPETIRPGQLTLRQLDELVNEYKQRIDASKQSSVDASNNESSVQTAVTSAAATITASLASKYSLSSEDDVRTLIHYYKPFTRIDAKKPNASNAAPDPAEVFPNLDNLRIDK